MIILQTSDFDGFQSISQSISTTPLLQIYIDRYEKIYIKKILGVTLGQLFIEDIQGIDLDSSAIETRFQTILDPFIKQQDNDGDVIYENKGMKDILASLIFHEFVSGTQVKHGQAGVLNNQAEVSTIGSPEDATRFGEVKWNEALESIEAIQWWCGTEDEANYPEYNGITFGHQYSPLL
jgi:hypothetical protein